MRFNLFKDLLTPKQRAAIGPYWASETHHFERSIIGEVEIVDCVQNHPSVWAERSWKGANYPDTPIEEMEEDTIIWNWVLANPVEYKQPIKNVKGKLSLWEYETTL